MWLWAASDIFLPLLCHGYLQGDRKSLCSFRKNNIFTGPKRLPKLHKHTPETSYHSIKLHLKQVFQSVYRGELETKISQKPRKPEITKLPDWSRRKAVAEFRLRVGHDCLGTHLHGSGIRHDPYCMLCSLHETMDRNRLGRCTELSSGTECKRYWEARTIMMETDFFTSLLLFLWLLLIIRISMIILSVFNVLFSLAECSAQCTNRPWTSIQDLLHPNSWQTPVAAVTVYSAPDDGRKGRPKHVEHTCSC